MKTIKKYLVSSLSFTLSTVALANQDQQKIADRLNDQRIQTETTVTAQPQNAVIKSHQNANNHTQNTHISISKAELAKQPDLVVRAMIPAVMEGNTDNVALLFPIYQAIPTSLQDPILTLWGKAILAKKEQNYRESIRLYREILAAQSNILNVRFQLAVALFENNELEAAEDQFQKLRSEPHPNVQQISTQYLDAIQQRDRWTFNGGLTYLNDPNINNAPKAGTSDGILTPEGPESAEGISFNINLGKKWSWGNGFYNRLRLDSDGKYYWNNKKYNELSTRGSAGLGFQNSQYNIEISPFMEQMLYAGGTNGSTTLKRFSKTSGSSLEAHYWLSPKWQLNGTYEYGERRYARRQHLNGNYHFISSGLLFFSDAKQYWFADLNYNRTSTRAPDDSFFRRGINLGWGQEWGKGLSTRFSISAAQKHYKGTILYFKTPQKNKEYNFQASIWHRAIHYWGITPRLTYVFSKTKSNQVFYSYDKHRVFVNFSKNF